MLRDVLLAFPGGMPANAYEIHERVYSLVFGPQGEALRDFLFTFEPEMGGLVTLRSENLPAELQAAGVPVKIPDTGAAVPFRLVASPTGRAEDRQSRTRQDGRLKTRAVPLPAGDTAARVAWLAHKAIGAGFALVGPQEVTTTAVGYDRRGVKFLQERSVFVGMLRVTDRERFIAALTKGIGRARALGFGILTTY